MTGKEVTKPDYEAISRARDAEVEKKLGPEFSVEKALEEGRQQIKDAVERKALVRWFTDVFDVLALQAPGHTDVQVHAWARREIIKKYPKKFARLIELEDNREVEHAKHEAAATAAHLTMVKQGMRW